MVYIPNIKHSMPCGFSQEDFFMFPFIRQCNICDPKGGPIFWPHGYNLNKLVGVCNCSMFCCTLLYVHYSIAIILMGKRERANCFA